MWKCIPRSVKTFRKTVLKKSTVLSTKAVQNEELRCVLKFTPSVLNRCNSFSNICRFSYFTKEKSDREGPKEKKTNFLFGFKEYVVDALKSFQSGLIIFAFYYTVYNNSKSIFIISDPHKEVFPRIIGYYRGFEYLIDTLKFTPYNCIFPEVQAGRARKDKQKCEVESETVKSDEENFSGLEEAHRTVLATVTNSLGIQYMQSGDQKKAFEYFLQSAKEEYAPGIFNLGLCHEKGYGTSQNFLKAAELYQKASDLGHAAAMYNLGVLYAQGKGEITLDVDHARELFKAAALLGQVDAERALKLEKQPTEEIPDDVLLPESGKQERSIFTLDKLIFDKVLDRSSCQSETDLCDNNNKRDCEYFEEKEELNSSLGSDSGILDLSPHDDRYVVLV